MVAKLIPIHFETIDSTNTYAKNQFSQFDPEGITRITAEMQTAGRGQFQRKWLSPKGLNIYLTYALCLEKEPMMVNQLTHVATLSILNLLKNEGVTPEIKWPNDLLVNGKKISGILCETVDMKSHFGVVLGIGINVNMEKLHLSEIDQPATSLKMETGKEFSPKQLIENLDALFLRDFALFLDEGYAAFYQEYERNLMNKNRLITLKKNHKLITAILHSLAPDGRLNLLLPSGEIETIISGEIER